MSRAAARETAVCLAYAMSMGTPVKEMLPKDGDAASQDEVWAAATQNVADIFKSEAQDVGKLRPQDIAYVRRVVGGIEQRLSELDALIDRHSIDWKISRMPRVDLSVLRVAVYELLYEEDLPSNVSANEAVECAKKYGDKKSPQFVNGVLSGILGEMQKDGQ